MDSKITNFPVNIYGNLEKYNETISKGRCRIFYKGANRNGTYITDEFAEKLLNTIAYAPIKGIFDDAEQDFSDHGEKRELGRIYGVVPADPQLTWESHLDEDGIERLYACVDVLLYTALYEEAKLIPGKSQSMELYAKSIKGDWQIIDGKRYYVYTDACFLGLQALGEEVEPCFEGAAFFSLYQQLTEMVNQLNNVANTQNQIQEEQTMDIVNFKMSDDQKFKAIWQLLNVNYNAENNWSVEYDICAVYDEYAVVKNYATGGFERAYYVKNDETDSVVIEKMEPCFIIDVSENEKQILDLLQKKGCKNYEQTEEHFTAYENLEQENSQNCTKIDELSAQNATLITERDNAVSANNALTDSINELTNNFNNAQQVIETLTAERDALASYKKNVEDANKRSIISQYTDNLTEEVIASYENNLDNFTADELDMKLTYEVKKCHPEIFSNTQSPAYVPKEATPTSGLTEILSRYEKH